jgi:transposase
VRLIPAQYVKPYVKTNKSDYIDAEAIAEAVARPTMRFVPIKSDDQLDLQSLHRVRERWVMRRTAVVNQIRGLLLERGITQRKGRCHLEAALPGILEDATMKLSGAVRLLLAQLKLELDQLAMHLEVDALIQKAAEEREREREKSVDAWMRFLVSGHLRQLQSSRQSVMEQPFARAVISPPGLA